MTYLTQPLTKTALLLLAVLSLVGCEPDPPPADPPAVYVCRFPTVDTTLATQLTALDDKLYGNRDPAVADLAWQQMETLIATKKEQRDTLSWIHLEYTLGKFLYNYATANQKDQARNRYDNALRLCRAYRVQPVDLMLKLYFNLAEVSLNYLASPYEAIRYAERSADLYRNAGDCKQDGSVDPFYVISTYAAAASAYTEIGAIERARLTVEEGESHNYDYYYKTENDESLREAKRQELISYRPLLNRVKADVLIYQENFDEAAKLLRQDLKTLEYNDYVTQDDRADQLDMLAKVLYTAGAFGRMDEIVHKSLALRQEINSPSPNSVNNRANYYLKTNDYRRAKKDFAAFRAMIGEKANGGLLGTYFEGLSEYALRTKDTLAAFDYLDSAYYHYHANPSSPKITDGRDYRQMQDVIQEKLRLLYLYHGSHPTTYPLGKVVAAIRRTDSINDLLQYQVQSEISKRFRIRELRKDYEGLINFAYGQFEKTGELAYRDLAMRSVEKSKARILRERKRANFESWNTEASRQEMDTIMQLTSQVKFLLSELAGSQPTNRAKPEIEGDLQEVRTRLLRLQGVQPEEVAGNIPGYSAQLTLRKMIGQLGPGEVIVDYFVGQDACFINVGESTGISLHRIPIKRERLKEMVRDLSAAIQVRRENSGTWKSSRSLRRQSLRRYQTAATQLYEILLRPVIGDGEQVSQLTVIPEDVLGGVPFAALLTEETPESELEEYDYAYLVKKCDVNYEFSTLLWNDRATDPAITSRNSLVIAPEQDGQLPLEIPGVREPISLAGLQEGAGEIPGVRSALKGEKLLAGGAAKNAVAYLRSSDNEQAIIHFAGHGVALPDDVYNSVLVLDIPAGKPPAVIRLNELEQQPWRCEMLVLSACQTGVGEPAYGEGVISLARAGAIAGARSVVSTLWLVNQEAKARFITDFYGELRSGTTGRDAALANAQRESIKRGEHPYFWAPFLHTGARAALPRSCFT